MGRNLGFFPLYMDLTFVDKVTLATLCIQYEHGNYSVTFSKSEQCSDFGGWVANGTLAVRILV